jgi:hypothetical protein
MSRSFAALLLLAFATARGAQDAGVPPLEGTVIRRLGNTHWRSAVELHAPAFSPAGDALARRRRVQVERQEEKPAVDRHGDPLPRTNADERNAVTLLLAIWHRMPHAPAKGGDRPFPTPAECRGGRSPVCSGPQRACGPLGLVPLAGCRSTQHASHTPLRRAETFAGASGDVARYAPVDGSF